jgi:hypothetical protein
MSTTQYEAFIYGTSYIMDIPNDQHRPHRGHAALFAAQHHCKCDVYSIRREYSTKGFIYRVQMNSGEVLLIRVQRISNNKKNNRREYND